MKNHDDLPGDVPGQAGGYGESDALGRGPRWGLTGSVTAGPVVRTAMLESPTRAGVTRSRSRP